jgi:phage-related protein (TIGR01555 family)
MSVISATERQEQLAAYKNAVRDYREGQFRSDGYLNMLNKVGTKQDNSQTWQWSGVTFETDQQLSNLYMGNGLFAKIIDRPAEDAVAKGFDLSDLGDEIEAKVKKRLTDLDFSNVLSTAEKWSRLYGGSIGVIICNDGRGLEEPLSVNSFENIEEIKVFERAVVQPDYSSLYSYSFIDQDDFERRKFGQPVFYDVYSVYGSFRVHYSRCLVFKNGELPENAAVGMYQFWGIPVYTKIKSALREAITAHQDGTKLLERSVLGVYKMKGLSQLLATDEGEDNVIKRLQVIDMARNIINSMAIDADGEDYQYINASMSGASDLIDRTCNMLSGVTDIPQTILFGRDPAGENSTGDNDRDNYFQLLNRIQTNAYQKPLNKIVKLILLELTKNGTIEKDIPDYEVRFAPLRQISEADQAAIDAQKAATEKTKADTANIYVAMQALDPSEVRKGLSEADDYQLQGIVDEDELELPESALEMPQEENPTDAEGKTLALSDGEGTIEVQNLDGAPIGNQNAAGPHNGSSNSEQEENEAEFTQMVADGRISLKVNAEKQARHTKGDKLYNQLVESGKHPSYIENTPSELQKIVDNASGGRLIKRKSNAFVRVASDDGFKGTCVDRETGEEARTNRFTIHYSKTGTHVVPTSQEEGE